ncbi:hypothetical protein [Paraherbaspirillum soli]|uniref:Uncharacterized protein n=1 Tax=Paraherbaspirillum soli TaxID=631222 RepID=A0ABW0MEK4_9BURK
MTLLLRKQLAEKSGRARNAGGAADGGGSEESVGGLEKSVVDRVQGLRSAGLNDQRQLRRMIVEAALKQELGMQVANDAEFNQVVDLVLDEIEGDEDMLNLIKSILDN